MRKFLRSLLARYMLIILMALSLIQLTYLFIAIFVFTLLDDVEAERQLSANIIKEAWHEEANHLENIKKEKIRQHFDNWQEKYPEAAFFWVDGDGMLAEQVNLNKPLPSKWTPAFTAKFMKERYDGDPFTVIAFVGKDEKNGFIVFEVSRATLEPLLMKAYDQYGTILFFGMISIILLFIIISFLFFRGIRKRLLHLQDAMTIRNVDGLPIQMKIKKMDEIGQLEQAFNDMVIELRKSKQHEQEEERLRRELIANLSHDLRTPLTKIRAQTYSIGKEDLSEDGKRAMQALESSIVHIDRLIENLMSYTLLIAKKYSFEPKEIDIIRFVREGVATWYPVFEKEGFNIDVELHSFDENKWKIDRMWFGRILDNVLQNVLRHAKDGLYVGVKTESTARYDAILIIDRGKGVKGESNEKGAGIGLSIVDMMVKGMHLEWDILSNEHGTTVKIKKYK